MFLSDIMNRCVSIFVVLVLITAGSVCVLFIHQDNVRSNVMAITPYSMLDESASGSMTIDDETYPYVIADVAFGVDLIKDGRSQPDFTMF